MNDYRIPHNPIFDNPKNSSSISNESPHLTKKEKKKIKKNIPRRGPRSRETFFQAPDRPLPTAGASPRSPSSRNAIGFCRRSGSTYRHRPTGTRGTRPASIEDRLRSAGISAMPAASVEQNDAENESSGEARRGEEKSGEKRRVVGSAVTEARGGGCGRGVGEGDSEEVERGEPGERSTSASPSSSLPMLWRGGGEGGEGRRRGPAAESERGARAESALGPSFRCRRQWQSQFLVASACRRRRGAPSV